VAGVGEPRIGDAFGETLRSALAEENGLVRAATIGSREPRRTYEIVERDDGMIGGGPAARYLSPPEEWTAFDRRALEALDGRTLDVGTGAGRLALALQDRDVPVVGLDVSPGAVEVARARGVRECVCATVEEHAAAGATYDWFALLGNNIGLLGSREAAGPFLSALARMARPGARIVAQGMDPYGGTDEVHQAYHERNRAVGRMGGQVRIRVRYRDLATEWFDYLHCTVDELRELTAATPWRVSAVDDADAPFYVAILELR
jgi:SAM-dependent methyltransferase